MTRGRQVRLVAAFTLTIIGAGIIGQLWAGPPDSQTLGGAERYLTSVSTDKPIYRAGETVYVRAVVLKADTHEPLTAEQTHAGIEIVGPKGDVVAQGLAMSEDSVVGFSWKVPDGQAGGEYTVKVLHPFQGHAPGERKFDIRAYRAPRLKSQIVFLRDGYGPRDEVSATVHVERAEGGIPAGAKVTVSARVDEQEVFTGPATVDARGDCTTRFNLPAEIARGLGTLSFAIEDGGVVETAAKTIPILLQTVDLQLYPEGGDLVAGLPTRVYLAAKTPAGKPADLAGVIVDADGKTVADFRTEHEGRGRFGLTPAKDGRYTLKITEPAGIKTAYPLPAVKESGAVIQSPVDIVRADEPVQLNVGATADGPVRVTLSRREAVLASSKLELKAGKLAEVLLTPPPSAEGVLIATVSTDKGVPLAERLIYRQPPRGLRVRITPEQAGYVPGDKVRLDIQTTDDHGEPVSGVVGVTVTDDSILEMIEKREQAPRLPVMVLLEQDVRELADAHVYLDPENPKAPLATDLLLGTQGWRRFALMDTSKFITRFGDDARRVLALRETAQMIDRFGGGNRNVRFFGMMPAPPMAAAAPGNAPGPVGMGGVADGAAVPEEAAAPAADDQAVERKDNAADLAKLGEPAREPAPAEKPADALAKRAGDPDGDEDREKAERRAGRPLLLEGRLEARQERMRNDFVVVRVYAHELRPNRRPGDRVDFTETLYWNAGIRTDAKTGKASIEFALNDAVSSFRVFADAFNQGGALGTGTALVESVQPFYLEPKLPLEITAGDIVLLPIGLVNGLSQDLKQVKLTAKGPRDFDISEIEPFTLAAKERARKLFNIRVGSMNGPADFLVEATAGPYVDKVTRTLTVRPMGFPTETAFGGLLGPDAPVIKTVVIPDTRVSRSLEASVNIYPTPLANLTQALEALIRQPSGCFEQTSSTLYPLVMAQQYFLSHTGIEPSLIERSKAMLDEGYARLIGFECKQKGYEWFGADPGHEALTAYGLLEFTDMSLVRDVDRAMIERTRDWLLKRRDGKGGYTLDAKALDSFGRAPATTTAAYITWALLESGQKAMESEITALRKLAESTQDSYIIALAANALALGGDAEGARHCRERLIKQQQQDGSVAGAVTSITCSGGEALVIEATSLAVLAWDRDPDCAGAVEKAIQFLAESCKAGRFGSTQSTILALRAIVAYDKSRARPKAPGKVQVFVDGRPMGDPVAFDKDTQGAIRLPDISELLEPGTHKLELRMTDGSIMPYAISVRYHDTKPASSDACKVGVKIDLADNRLTEGQVSEVKVTVTNRADVGIPTPVAIIGLPGGLEPRHDQLKELVKSGTVAAYEVIGREVVLYWRQLKPHQEVSFPISVVAAVPGSYTGPASRAYLYYTDEHKSWVDGVQVQIAPR